MKAWYSAGVRRGQNAGTWVTACAGVAISPAELLQRLAPVALPSSDMPAALAKSAYVWDESKGID